MDAGGGERHPIVGPNLPGHATGPTGPHEDRTSRLAHPLDNYLTDPRSDRLYLSLCRIQQFPGGYAAEPARLRYPQLRIYTQYLEAKLYWEYTQRWDHAPALHYKKGSRDRARR